MKTIKFIFFFFLGLVSLYICSNFFFSKEFNISRSIIIDTSPYIAFDQINDFKNWENWDPWIKNDSTLSISYGDITSGVGASRCWTSVNSGNGSMKITESDYLKQITFSIKIDDFNNFKGTLVLESVEEGLKVSWTDSGDLPFLVRVLQPFLEIMMGNDFEKGLSLLKKYCESLPSTSGDIEFTSWNSNYFITQKDSCQSSNVDQSLGTLFSNVYQQIGMQGIKNLEAPFAQYLSFPKNANDENKVILRAGTLITKPIEAVDGFELGQTTEGNIIKCSHYGAYEMIFKTHEKIKSYCKENDLTIISDPFEFYVTDPSTESDMAKWRTDVVYEIE